MGLAFLFLIAALILFLVAAFGINFGRVSPTPLGLACLVLAQLVGTTAIG